MKPILFFLSCALLSVAQPLRAQELPLDSLLRTPVNAASKYAQTINEVAASVTVITADDIRRYGYRTLDEILRAVPGFYTTYDRNKTNLGVRGFSRPGDYNNRILVLIDGHTMNEGVNGSAPMGTELALDADHIERVEIVSGPGSALYGTGAMLASINIVTVNGRTLNGLRATVGGGSLGERHVTAALGGEVGRKVQVSLAGQWSESDGQDLFYPEYNTPATNGGVAHNLDYDRHRSVLLGVTSGGWGLSAFASTREKGIPTGAYGIDFNDSRASAMDDSRFLELSYATPDAATAQLTFRGFANQHNYTGVYPLGGQVNNLEAADDAVGTEARLRLDIGSRNRVLFGTEYDQHVSARDRAWNPAAVLYNIDAPYGVFSVYAQDEIQVATNLSAVLGLRHDVQGGASGSTSPRLAMLYHPSGRTTLKVLYGEAFRAPSAYERTFDIASAGFEISSGLRAERIRTYEAVWEQRVGPAIFGSASAYHYQMRDLIDTQLDPTDSLLQFRNVSLATSTGVTLALNGRFQGGTSAYLSYGYQATSDGTTGLRLTNSPQHLIKGGAGTPFGRHLLVSGEARYESSRGTVYGTRTVGYLWTGLHLIMSTGILTGRPGSGSGVLARTEFSVTLANLFDAHYATPGGFMYRQAAIEQDGRSVRAGLRIWW